MPDHFQVQISDAQRVLLTAALSFYQRKLVGGREECELMVSMLEGLPEVEADRPGTLHMLDA